MSFCDFCECENCQTGYLTSDIKLLHAETVDGRWICDVCFSYDLCTSGPNRVSYPCENKECEHRPKLISRFKK